MSSFEPPRSLPREDAPPPPKPKKDRTPQILVAALMAVLLLIGAGLVSGFVGTGERDGGVQIGPVTIGGSEQTTSSEIVNTPAPEGESRVLVAVDGWSWQSLKGTEVRYVARAEADEVPTVELEEGEVAEGEAARSLGQGALQFVPADREGLEALGRTSPLLLRDVAARLVSSDISMECDAEGCSWSGAKLSAGELAEPAKVPHFGKVYEGYELDSLVYVAAVNLPAEARVLEVQAEGYTPVELGVNVQESVSEAGEVAEPASLNGYLQDRYLLAAAFGELFAPEASWLGQNPPIRAVDPEVAPLAGPVPTLPELSLLQGLGVRVGRLGLTPSQLTYFSSPTTGCGSALCVPGRADVTLESEKRTPVAACTTTEGAPPRMAAAVRDVTLRVRFPAPTHQFGAYGEAELGKFPNQRGVALIGGEPPLVEGEHHLRFLTTEFYATGGESPQLVGALSRVLDERVDAELFATEIPVAETLGRASFAGARYAPCP